MGLYYRLDFKKTKRERDKNSPIPVVIDYYYNGQRTKVSTGVTCLEKNWDKDWRKKTSKSPVKTLDKDHRSKNLLIKNKLDEINGIVLTLQKQDKEPIVELVKSYLRKDRKEKRVDTQKEIHFLPLFVEYDKWIKSNYNPQRDSTKRGVISSIKQIIEYTTEYQNKNHTLLFPDELDRDWVYGFVKWSYDRKGLKPSTINKRIKVLSHFSSWSKEKYNMNFQIRKPKDVYLGGDENIDIVFLKRDEVLKLFNYELFNSTNKEHIEILTKEKRLSYITDTWTRKDGTEKQETYTTFEIYKDMLLFLCNVGCRYGDMVSMKIGDFVYDDEVDDKLGYKRGMFSFFMEKKKVQRTPVKVPMNKMTYEIWKKYSKNKHTHHYLFPRTTRGNSISNNKFNKYIKDVCRIVELNRYVKLQDWDLQGKQENTDMEPLYSQVSSHIGRRTFIREQIERGVPTRVIMRQTGHKSRKVFDGYYEVLDEDIMRINDDLFNEHIEKKTSTNNSPITKEKEEEIEKLKYSLDKEWITQEKYDKLFQQIMFD